jgi:hypothetical protein
MKSAILMAGLLFFVGASLPHAQAQPSIAAATVVNAASRIPKGLPNYGIAQGSLFTLTGQGLVTAATPPITVADSPLPLTLAGASMQITVGGTKVDVPMVSAWLRANQGAGELAGVALSNTPAGDGKITVTATGSALAPIPSWLCVRNLYAQSRRRRREPSPARIWHSARSWTHRSIGPTYWWSYRGNTLVVAAHILAIEP